MKENDIDVKLCLGEANVFYRVAKSINGRNFFLQNGESYPFAVNLSFSCELYLKYLLLINGIKYGSTHYLDQLYGLLPSKMKNEIKFKFELQLGKNLDEFLNNQAKTFTKWRYAFEKGGLLLDYSGFMVFSRILRNIANHNKETIVNRKILRLKKAYNKHYMK